jgi:hypothetical protein
LGAQHGKLDADFRTSAFLGTPSVQSVHDYYRYPIAMEDRGRLAHMAAELVDRAVILVAFVASMAWVLLTLVLCVLTVMFVCNISFVELLHVRRFWGDVREKTCIVFWLLFMVLWVPISATLCKRAVLMLWHAFMFLGLRLFFPPFFFLGGLRCLFF